MNIEELTNRLLEEGVEKGNQEAEKILQDAKLQADNIIAKAQEEARKIKEQAQNDIEEKEKHIKAELQLCASQIMGSLQTRVADMICGKVIDENIKALETNPTFLCEMIANIAQQNAKDGDVTIQTNLTQPLTDYFIQNAKNLLNNGIKIMPSDSNKLQFDIVCETKNYKYKLKFGEEEFKEFFTSLLRQQIVDYLF